MSTEAAEGPAERELRRLGHRYAGMARTVIVALCGLMALLAAPAQYRLLTTAVVVVLVAWSALYLRWLLRGPSPWLLAADVLAGFGVCLTQRWTVASESLYDGTSWVLVVASITVVAYQWHTSVPVGAAATLAVVCGYLLGSVIAAPGTWTSALPFDLWMLAEAAMSRGLFLLVRRGGRVADELAAQAEVTRRENAVSAARRADEREFLAALHDTAAATLLMISLGTVSRREPWLAEQASRDLDVLAGGPHLAGSSLDLVDLLDTAVHRSRLRVEWTREGPIALPPAPAVALFRSVREALTNTANHAQVDEVALHVEQQPDKVVVAVVDRGRGFDPAGVPAHRRGISGSIVERMARAGGLATVESSPGAGTRIRLEWPHA